jgi:H+/Cl- antiporter ClcA
MFSSLMKRWKVRKKDVVVILCVFAITGFSTAWLSKLVTTWIGFDQETHWSAKLSVRLAVLLFGYQVLLLLVAFLLGQFSFFWKYEKRFLQRLGLLKTEKHNQKTNKRI